MERFGGGGGGGGPPVFAVVLQACGMIGQVRFDWLLT